MKYILLFALFLVCFSVSAQVAVIHPAKAMDPLKINCVERNHRYTISISYRFKASVWEQDQRQFQAECYVDNNWTVTVPPFFAAKGAGGTEPNYDEISQALSFMLQGKKDNCNKGCVSLFDLGKQVTEFYQKLFPPPDNNLSMIYVFVVPGEADTKITVVFKGKTMLLDYKAVTLDQYLLDPVRKKIIGKKWRYCRVDHISRCSKQRPAGMCSYHSLTKSSTSFPELLPGDIIIIK